MTELTATVQMLTPDATLVVPRDLTSHEQADLERLRAPLPAVDRTDSRAVSWFWDRVVPAQAGTPAPAGLVEWVGVALGDLLVTHVPGSRWVVCPGPSGPTLGVVGTAHPLAPVVPLPDAQDRWAACTHGWIGGYLGAAAAHLAGVTLPQPRPSSENAPTSRPGPEPVHEPVAQVAVDATTEPEQMARPGATTTSDGTTTDAASTVGADAGLRTDEWAPVVVPTPGATLPCRGHGSSHQDTVAAPAAPAAAPLAPVAPAAAPVAPAVSEHPGSPEHPAGSAHAASPERPTNLPHPPSAAAQDLALRALEHALVVLRRGPFDREAFVILVDDSGTRTLACTGEPAQALRQARDTARTSGARAAAVGWIDRHPTGVPDPRQGFPAVLVEASEAGVPGLQVAHRFVEDALGTGPLGDPVLVGEVPPLL